MKIQDIGLFGTIIMDTYKKDEVKTVAEYLEEICSPQDSYGWSSAGIYSFWDYESREILYIGLTSDLGNRFKQHNGLLHTSQASCKYEYIKEYFINHEKMGYTIFVQSSLSQPKVYKNQNFFRKSLDIPKGMPIKGYGGEEGRDSIKTVEGQLIEAHRLAVGNIPSWNKMSGSSDGKMLATLENYFRIVKRFSDKDVNNVFVSRSTLRELAENATYQFFEEILHTVRMTMLSEDVSFVEALKIQLSYNLPFAEGWKRIIQEEYLSKQLWV